MTWLVARLIGWGVPAKLAKPLLIAVGVILIALAAWGVVKIHDRRVIATHDDHAEIKTLQTQRKANDAAADQRSADTIEQAHHELEAHNAIAAQPDQPISPTSRALGCERLRRAGKDISRIPACVGPASGH